MHTKYSTILRQSWQYMPDNIQQRQLAHYTNWHLKSVRNTVEGTTISTRDGCTKIFHHG